MSNPLFEAALLQRGLRAMDVALGQLYDVNNHVCLPSGGVYPNEFPAEGVDFRKYEGGVEGLKGIWKNWMYEDGGKGDLKKDVHPMVNETVVHAFKILGTCDESKDGHITKAEWEKCQKFKSAEDALYDFEYVYALDQVSGKMLKLLKENTLNPADPNTYPELKEANSTISAKEVRISALETTLGKTREELAHSQKVGIGFGSLAVLSLIFGVVAMLRARRYPTEKTPPQGGPAPSPAPAHRRPAAGAIPGPDTASPASAVEFVIGKEPAERSGLSGFTLSNLEERIAKMVSRNHLLVRVEGGRYLVQEIGQNAGTATIERAGARIAIPRATDANPWIELARGDAINIAGAVRLPFSGAPAAGAGPVSPFALEAIAPAGTPAAAPAAAPAPAEATVPAAAPSPASAAPRSPLDQALDGLDANDVAITEVPNVATINAEAIERQIRFLFPELDNARYSAVVQDLADEVLNKLQGLGGEDFKTEFQHELASYRDVMKAAAPTRFLIKTIEERLTVHRRSIDTARVTELIRIAEDDRSHAGRREELREAFRRAASEAAKKAAP